MQNILYASAVGSIMYVVRCTRPDVAFAQNMTSRFQHNPGVVDWKSTKQSIFATSSTDAEYIAAFNASKEVVWIRKFIFGLGVVPTIKEPISMYYDNTGAISIAKDHRVTKGASPKHSSTFLPNKVVIKAILGSDVKQHLQHL
ncbi:hypothetical protein Tco_0691965 [Tanacetum coccineum]